MSTSNGCISKKVAISPSNVQLIRGWTDVLIHLVLVTPPSTHGHPKTPREELSPVTPRLLISFSSCHFLAWLWVWFNSDSFFIKLNRPDSRVDNIPISCSCAAMTPVYCSPNNLNPPPFVIHTSYRWRTYTSLLSDYMLILVYAWSPCPSLVNISLSCLTWSFSLGYQTSFIHQIGRNAWATQ